MTSGDARPPVRRTASGWLRKEGAEVPGTSSLFISYDGPSHDYLFSLFIPMFQAAELDVVTLGLHPEGHPPDDSEAIGGSNVGRVLLCGYPSTRSQALVVLGALWRGWRYARKVLRSVPVDRIHTRSHIPAIIGLALKLEHPGLALIVDLDGEMPLERVDEGLWTRWSPSFVLLTAVGGVATRMASAVVCRSIAAAEKERRRLGPRRGRVVAIGNGVDNERFRPPSRERRQQARDRLSIPPGELVVGYSGSIGRLYLPEVMVTLLSLVAVRDEGSRFVIATHHPDSFREVMRRCSRDLEGRSLVRSFPADEVPLVLDCLDVALALRCPAPSQRAVSPVKVGEYLSAGIPIVTNHGISDYERLFPRTTEAVHVLEDFGVESLAGAADWIVDRRGGADRSHSEARDIALRYFSQSRMAGDYRGVYDSVGRGLGNLPQSAYEKALGPPSASARPRRIAQ